MNIDNVIHWPVCLLFLWDVRIKKDHHRNFALSLEAIWGYFLIISISLFLYVNIPFLGILVTQLLLESNHESLRFPSHCSSNLFFSLFKEKWSFFFKLFELFYFHQEVDDLRLLIFLLAVLIPPCASSSPAFLMMYSAYKLNKQGDNIQIYSLDVLLSLFEISLLFHVQF